MQISRAILHILHCQVTDRQVTWNHTVCYMSFDLFDMSKIKTKGGNKYSLYWQWTMRHSHRACYEGWHSLCCLRPRIVNVKSDCTTDHHSQLQYKVLRKHNVDEMRHSNSQIWSSIISSLLVSLHSLCLRIRQTRFCPLSVTSSGHEFLLCICLFVSFLRSREIWVPFVFNVSCSSHWGHNLINTTTVNSNENQQFQNGRAEKLVDSISHKVRGMLLQSQMPS